MGVVEDRILKLPGHIVVGLVQEPNQAVDLVPSLVCIEKLNPDVVAMKSAKDRI